MPVVHISSCVTPGVTFFSSLIWNPTVCPNSSQRSHAMRSASEIADTRRGCVHTMFAPGPSSGLSSTNCGTWVDLPHPVSPLTTVTWWETTVRTMWASCLATGNACRPFNRLANLRSLARLSSML